MYVQREGEAATRLEKKKAKWSNRSVRPTPSKKLDTCTQSSICSMVVATTYIAVFVRVALDFFFRKKSYVILCFKDCPILRHIPSHDPKPQVRECNGSETRNQRLFFWEYPKISYIAVSFRAGALSPYDLAINNSRSSTNWTLNKDGPARSEYWSVRVESRRMNPNAYLSSIKS